MSNSPVTVCYGESGKGKTTQIEPFSIYIAETTHLPTLLISGDGGGYAPIGRAIRAGLVEVVELASQEKPMGLMRNILQGKSKDVDLRRFGAIAIDGLTSIANLFLRNQTAQGRKISQDVVGMFDEMGQKFGAPPPSLYGLVQMVMLDILTIDLKRLPSNIKRVYMTAHESKGQDTNMETVYGPATVGKAGLGQIQPATGDTLHFDTVEDSKKNQIHVAWFKDHLDPKTKIPYITKSRLEPRVLATFAEKYPEGYIPLIFDKEGNAVSSIADYFRFLDSLSETVDPELSKLLTKA